LKCTACNHISKHFQVTLGHEIALDNNASSADRLDRHKGRIDPENDGNLLQNCSAELPFLARRRQHRVKVIRK
jgi:hypothetical protein